MEKANIGRLEFKDGTLEYIDCSGRIALLGTADIACAGTDTVKTAEYLLLPDTDINTDFVRAYAENNPSGTVVATPYVLLMLRDILGTDINSRPVARKTVLTFGDTELTLTPAARPLKPAYMEIECGGEKIRAVPEKTEKCAGENAVIIYYSRLDHTGVLANLIADGIADATGARPEIINLAGTSARDAVKAVSAAGAVLLGTGTADGDAYPQMNTLLALLGRGDVEGKYAAAFGSYIHTDDGVKNTLARLGQLGAVIKDGGFAVQYRPDDVAKKAAVEYGYAFGCFMKNIPNTHLSRLVKCTVCGEIFDSSLGVCPVCGVGMDKCVPVEDEVISLRRDTDTRYVIIGSGVAAISAAEAIRKRDKTGCVTLVSRESGMPINRPMLSKNMIGAALIKDKLTFKNEEWFTENGITLRTGLDVSSVDAQNKLVYIAGEDPVTYDKLIYAAGAECFIPPIPGREKEGVFAVRHLEDVKRLWKHMDGKKDAVVIGGGVLGLETAGELKKARKNVTVLETAPTLMSRQLDDETAAALTEAADKYGIKILTGVNVTAIEGGNSVSGVRLADGSFFAAKTVVISCGNRANIDIIKAAGAECGRAVKVDAKMRTSLADIYACGDCAEYMGGNYQLWSEALEQGRIAGAAAAGDDAEYIPQIFGTSFEGMNTSLFAVGDTGRNGDGAKTVSFTDEISGAMRRYRFRDGVLRGAILFGDTSRTNSVSEWLAKGLDYRELADKL